MFLNYGAGEDSWESSLDCKEIKPVNPKGNQPWIFTGRTHDEAETLILWPPDVKSWLGKDPDAGKDWSQKEKGAARKSWLDSITNSMNLCKLQETVKDRKAWCTPVDRVMKNQTELSNWITTTTENIKKKKEIS